MILVDYSNLAIAAVMRATYDTKVTLTRDVVKHVILNSIRARNVQFRREFGQMVICCDDSNNKSWREKIFPHYKAQRKLRRKADDIDWDMIYEAKDAVQEALIDHFPYPVVGVASAEADDIIGWFTLNTTEPCVIIANDKDFHQCHSQLVCQWKNSKKLLVRYENPKKQLLELIIRGDADDGIPNFRSDDDTFVDPDKRQRPISAKKMDEWLQDREGKFLEEEVIKAKKVKGELKPEVRIDRKANFMRNAHLIDFKLIPQDIKDEIMQKMTNLHVVKNKKTTFSWLTKNNMSYLLTKFSDFF